MQESGVRRPVESESYFERLQIGRYGCCAFDGGTYICLFAIPFYLQSSANRQSQIYRTGILATANIKQEKKTKCLTGLSERSCLSLFGKVQLLNGCFYFVFFFGGLYSHDRLTVK